MNKAELIDQIHGKVDGIRKSQVAQMVDALVDAVTQSVAAGTDVNLTGFGKFTRTERAARTGRNPRSGAPLRIPASKTPTFKPGKVFKDAVNR
ncbi:DNA-binding protein [Spiribacter halobius]|uniref:DNA-binding protein n=1 Tax=Sediminicurvatus halobius TaxID=2182432 RepID=A0A2U2MVY1_9GAMM|nr:DNA-binding protein [Spiribacter halobius]